MSFFVRGAMIVPFYKLQASGNDFILLDARNSKKFPGNFPYRRFAQVYCRRKFGIGADGLLVVQRSTKSAFAMKIFNPDGSLAEMCGNGARCVALWASQNMRACAVSGRHITFETGAGNIASCLKKDGKRQNSPREVSIRILDTVPQVRALPVTVSGLNLGTRFINTGVPHAVVFVENLDAIDVEGIGRTVRFHEKFMPAGTNVDFVEITGVSSVRIRTYERGVEAETLACGTGVTASALVAFSILHPRPSHGRKTMRVTVASGETLKVHFTVLTAKIHNVWLEGKACQVYTGAVFF